MIALALRVLDDRFGLAGASGLYASPAWPDPADPAFVNAAAALRAAPAPPDLLAALHRIEAAFGRRRTHKNAPRTLDLDLLAYNELSGDGPPLLPHPGLRSRGFVLAPLADIAAGFRPPGAEGTIAEMLGRLGPVPVTRLDP